jgi:hypothetical protein
MRIEFIPKRSLLIALGAAFLFCLAVPARAQEYRIGVPVPAWVRSIEPDLAAAAPEEDVSDGLYYVLIERQVNDSSSVRARYTHEAYRIANDAGLENAGTLTVDFDPAYERLTVNLLRVRREGRTIDLRKSARLSVIQRETDLEYRIYDGSKTFTAILPGLRVGDVVEYGYTIEGSNPVFGGRLFDYQTLQGTSGVRRSYYRVVVPQAKRLVWKSFARDLSPAVSRSGGDTEYVWDVSALGALLPDENLPDWYFVCPEVQVSDYGSWADVAAWALNLYRPLFDDKAGILALARELAPADASEERAIMAFVSYVQNVIRYLGIEVGANSQRPNPPGLVVERRFGDCKDKSVLLAALCRARGIAAWPVLVNSTLRSHVADFLPGPDAFDHVIVLLRHEGRDYWIDPTVTRQATSLAAVAQADFETGLVVAESATGLAAIPSAAGAEPEITVTETFDLSGGNRKPASLVVTTTYGGAMADARRRTFALNSRQKVQKDLLAYYSDFYSDIESSADLVFSDDRAKNAVTVTESYSIKKPWQKNGDDEDYGFSLYPDDLTRFLQKPKSIKRSSPYAIDYPLHVRAVKSIRLPRSRWDLKDEALEVKNDFFVFSTSFTYRRSVAECRFEYRALRDHVPADQMIRYAADLDKIDDQINYSLTTSDPDAQDLSANDTVDSSPPPGSLLFVLIFALGPLVFLAGFFSIRAIRRAKRFRQ